MRILLYYVFWILSFVFIYYCLVQIRRLLLVIITVFWNVGRLVLFARLLIWFIEFFVIFWRLFSLGPFFNIFFLEFFMFFIFLVFLIFFIFFIFLMFLWNLFHECMNGSFLLVFIFSFLFFFIFFCAIGLWFSFDSFFLFFVFFLFFREGLFSSTYFHCLIKGCEVFAWHVVGFVFESDDKWLFFDSWLRTR